MELSGIITRNPERVKREVYNTPIFSTGDEKSGSTAHPPKWPFYVVVLKKTFQNKGPISPNSSTQSIVLTYMPTYLNTSQKWTMPSNNQGNWPLFRRDEIQVSFHSKGYWPMHFSPMRGLTPFTVWQNRAA
jgi:hypothetical protein